MVIARACAHRSLGFLGRSTRVVRKTDRIQLWRRGQKRTYASGGEHGGPQKSGFSGDLPWAIGSLVITIPSAWYLAQPQIERYSGKKKGHEGHGHGHNEGEHGEQGQDSEENEEGGEDGESAETEEAGKDAESEGEAKDGQEETESNTSDSDEEQEETPETSDDEGSENVAHETDSGNNVEGVQFKGATSGGEQGDTRKHIPDAKGFNKKRIESHYGLKQGEAQTPEQDSGNEDMAATAKAPAGMNKQSGKQEGLSNTDTKHSTDIAGNPDKSTKPTGSPETAKEKGTVDPQRPAS